MSADTPPAIETVLVNAARLQPLAGEAAFSVLHVDDAELAQHVRLDESLAQVPGLSLFRRSSSLSANPTTQGVSLRAIAPSGAGRSLVTLDGVPQNDPFGGWVIWTSLPPEAIESADIVRGAGIAAYGAGALTGIIALDERNEAAGHFAVDGQAGGEGEGRAAGVATGAIGPVRLFVSGAGETNRGWIPVHQGRGAADAALTLSDWTTGLRLQSDIGRTTIAARLGAYAEDRGAGLVGAASRASGTTASLSAAAMPEPGLLGWRAQIWLRDSDLRNSSVAVASGRTATTPANDQYATPATGWGANMALRGADGPFEWEGGGDIRAATGESREHFRFMSGSFTRDRRAGGDTLVAGAYAQITERAAPWLLTGGARLDYWSSSNAHRIERDLANGMVTLDQPAADRDGTVPSARIGVRRDFDDGLYMRAAAYTGFRPPTLNELHRPFRVGNDITESNPELKPEHLYGVDAAFGGTHGDTDWNVTVFLNTLSDAITNVTIGIGPGTFPSTGFVPAGGVLRQRQNAGQINATGLEADVEHHWGDDFSLSLAANVTDARVDGGTEAAQLTGKRPAQAPRVTMTAAADWHALTALRLHADVRYETARFEDDLNIRVLAPATTANMRADWSLSRTLSVFAACDNLFNAATETGETADGVLSYGVGRLWRIGLSVRE